ncbi:uncharacterized protein N7496_011507 [Penicillium cataractarum]|uniref:alpha-L-rhamnosidase n=1 Tax=Penicillium cataractarum TaxID=2100454 RepID=A0A9W9UWD8_9EURO|nr:uncharacterized protein N7496_011507 [Penicillium cataractarum]KAJ5359094.1 hypothetical protein N7496_011507 [Penicillium cataractarum]
MALHPVSLRVNLLSEPLGIDTSQPEFSWQLSAQQAAVLQSAYQIQVSERLDFSAPHWDSGVITSDLPYEAQYNGAALVSCRRYYWRVRVWDQVNQPGNWSDVSWFETAFLPGSNGPNAQWISRKSLTPLSSQLQDRDVLYFRRDITLQQPACRARVYASGLGWYKLVINGVNVTGRAQVPRWTPYENHLEYSVFDVGLVLREGHNCLGAIVADGHYRGENNGLSHRNCYGDRLGLFCLLVVDLEDGQQMIVRSDNDWAVTTGRIVHSDPKAGETADFRIPDVFDDDMSSGLHAWESTDILPIPTKHLIAEETVRVDEIDRRPTTHVWWSPKGQMLVDFGQNMVGHVRVLLRGPRDTKVTLTFSEVLTPEGELDLAYLEPVGKDRPQQDKVLLSGTPAGDWFEPMFTIHGFRYVALTGLDALLSPDEIEAIVISSQFTGWAEFDCSDSRLAQLFRNTVCSFRGNFTDTATDCPTRERSGWTGDLQVFASTAVLLTRDVQSFLRRYLRNLRAEQWDDGRIPPFIPSGDSKFAGVSWLSRLTASAVGWGDVCVHLPWKMHCHFGETTILERQFDSMRRWVDALAERARNKRSWTRWLFGGPAEVEQYIVDTGFHWGEWLRPGETSLVPLLVNLFLWPNAAIPTAYLAESSRILGEIAGALGRKEDEASYRELACRVREAWQKTFVSGGGYHIAHDKQDDYVRAVQFGLVSGVEKEAALARLAQLVEQAEYHLATGFLSTGELLPTLITNGYVEEGFRVLLQTTAPSWLYAVEHGATTVWESWEGCTPEGQAVLSQNHYAPGAVVAWLLQGLAGINPAVPGWRRIRIAPQIGSIMHAYGSVDTPFGRVTCHWRREQETDDIHLELHIPPGTTAEVQIGDGVVLSKPSGYYRVTWSGSQWAEDSS